MDLSGAVRGGITATTRPYVLESCDVMDSHFYCNPLFYRKSTAANFHCSRYSATGHFKYSGFTEMEYLASCKVIQNNVFLVHILYMTYILNL